MTFKKIRIRFFSELKDTTAVTSAINKLNSIDFDLIFSASKDLIADSNDIILIQIDSLDSDLLNKVIDLKSVFVNRIIFIVPDDRSLLISTLVKLGFTDIFVFPFEVFKFSSHLAEIVEKHKIKMQNERGSIFDFTPGFFSIKSSSPQFNKVYEISKKLAATPSLNILIIGETGTGKGLLARTIHQMANGSEAPFVDVLCTAIPETLLESELFGHERGAFTNAQSRKLGLFELAEGGTLFLDEIGDLSYNIQSKLLRAIEKKVIRRLGGLHDIPINTRIITATNRSLPALIEKSLFRDDLFYRLNGITVELPPLRERNNDIIPLAKFFISLFNRQFNKDIKRIDREVRKYLHEYKWPGNIREFKNAIERAVLLGESSSLRLKFFPKPAEVRADETASKENTDGNISLSLDYHKTSLDEINKIYAKRVLELLDGKKLPAAKVLGISRTRLDRLLK